MSLLKLTDVGMLYGGRVPALEHINLTVEKGDWLAVMGPSGSGKTTLMNIIGCMDSATSGEVILAQYYHSIPDKKEAMEALARVGLEDRAGHLPSELSGGEQQRVCIARALINYPVLILADEPTGNLDEKNEKLVMNLFRELNEEGHTIITVTHSDHVGKAAKRIVIIEHGHMREGGEEEKA